MKLVMADVSVEQGPGGWVEVRAAMAPLRENPEVCTALARWLRVQARERRPVQLDPRTALQLADLLDNP